jgi:hypothetical protein
MFIEPVGRRVRPPSGSGGTCLPSRTHTVSWVTDMALLTEGVALLTEGGLCSGEIYEHDPLTEGGRIPLLPSRPLCH